VPGPFAAIKPSSGVLCLVTWDSRVQIFHPCWSNWFQLAPKPFEFLDVPIQWPQLHPKKARCAQNPILDQQVRHHPIHLHPFLAGVIVAKMGLSGVIPAMGGGKKHLRFFLNKNIFNINIMYTLKINK